ncbi:uncharacterized protein CTHT_0064300 [Thermochaetoides thermophila DSM 1495]|uniref:Uncharacterized protein n=1 Tax=Chaetomium thermophilum (strain DSM 1495 / CBS 144.50 / IMI 039719) TaxID=759272 RepID=G0SEM7_CHATD|nr:hypothetical protein CTHT_0064300 [Thermochaetoides thermophila DSM 1495]EGS18404.1 hypothetical protein CTHT_0064300 [Thermochaetoides thermophila DSM 1495]
MCYYDQLVWRCGYWKWSVFREQCPRERRMGETCGLRLVMTAYFQEDICKLCDEINKKQRRIEKMSQDIARWKLEGNRRATIDRTTAEIKEIEMKLDRLRVQHEGRIKGRI